MSLEQIALVASILSSVAVIMTLVFVGIQLKQNAAVNRMAASLTGVQLLSQNFGRVMENPDLADLVAGGEDKSEWTAGQRLRASNFLSVSMRHFEVLHTHQRYGIHEEELWLATEARLRESLSNQTVKDWWKLNRHVYAKSFATHVDVIIAELKSETSVSE